MQLQTRFQFKDLAKVLISIGVLVAGVMAAVSRLGTDIDVFAHWHVAFLFLLIYTMQFALIYLPLWVWVVRPYFASTRDFQMVSVPIKTVIKQIILLYLTFAVISIAMALIAQSLGVEVPGYHQQESYLPFFGTDTLGLTIGFLTVTLLAPLGEEIFFRGFVLPILMKYWPTWLASFLCAVLFALAHFQFQNVVPLIILGLLLNTAAIRTGSIWTSIAFHSMNNAIAFALELYLYFNPQNLL